MKTLYTRHPWILSIGSALAFFGLALIGTPLGNLVETALHLPVNSSTLIQQLLLAAFTALLLTWTGSWQRAGFLKALRSRDLLLCLPLLAAPVIMLFITGFTATSPLQVAMLVVFTALVGFTEEGLFRGVMLQSFLPAGPMRAALWSSLIFGGMHLINLFYGQDLTTGLLVVIYTSLIGFGFAAPYLKSGGAIWSLVIVHAAFDLLGKLGHGWGVAAAPTGSLEVVIRLGFAFLVAGYGFWLLRARPQATPEPGLAQVSG